MTNKRIFIVCALVFTSAFFIRLINLQNIPPGVFDDEASQGYDAYSLVKTGKDQYGQIFPVFLRSFGTYGSPLYSYYSTLPVAVLGLGLVSLRLTSVIFGSLLTILTFILTRKLSPEKSGTFATISSFLIAFSPWSVFFSRAAFEANLALTLFVTSFCLLLISKPSLKRLLLAALCLSLSTYAYHSYIILVTIFLLGYTVIKRNYFRQRKSLLICTYIAVLLILSPQLLLFQTPASNARISEVNYSASILSRTYSPTRLINNIAKYSFLAREFISQYSAYFSPRNLLYLPNTDLHRSIPGLSIFYPWMITPLFIGIYYFFKISQNTAKKLFVLLLFASPISASLTKDPFAIYRALLLWWLLTLIIALGVNWLPTTRLNKKVVTLISTLFISISLLEFYSSYFVLLPKSRSPDWGYTYLELTKIINKRPNSHFVIDSSRGQPPHIFILFYNRYPPELFQKQSGQTIIDKYYTATKFDRSYNLGNISIRPINLGEDIYKDQILVGDNLTISGSQATEHKLQKIFTINDLGGNPVLFGYQTNPREKCRFAPDIQTNPHCRFTD